MSNIEISKINIDETQLLIKDAQNRQDLASLSTEVQSISTNLTNLFTSISTNLTNLFTSISTNLNSLSTSISTNLTTLSTEVQSISTNLNSLSTSISTNYLPLSGGTLTGELTTSSHLTIKDDTLDTNSLEEMWPRHFSIKDKNDTTRGYFEIYQQPDGTQGFQIEAQRLINDKPIYNGIRLAITSTGGRLIRVTPGAESAWRNALGASNGVWPTSLGGTGGTDSGWQSVTSDVFSGTIYYRKIGHFGEIYGYGLKLKSALDNNNALQLATIDSSYKPSKGFMMPFGSSYISGVINLTGSGVINLYKDRNVSTMTTSMSFYFNYTYII